MKELWTDLFGNSLEAYVLLFLVAYLLGSLPFGVWVSRMFGVSSLQTQGSGNTGATNVVRLAGVWPAGAVTLVLDSSKAAFAVVFALPAGYFVLPDLAGGKGSFAMGLLNEDLLIAWGTCFFVVLGHCFSIFLRFKGGKGVSTVMGGLALLAPVSVFIGVIAFFVTFLKSRTGSLASIAALLSTAVSCLVFEPHEEYLLVGAAILFLILMRHDNNMNALLKGQEPVFE